ncbi:MAG TPA: hypothetical protein VHT75_18000 [Acidimicrobiales bacterium]|jgi:hypothetical protein|nr:hypothetical protein [Acidimicrobiales bacterium]
MAIVVVTMAGCGGGGASTKASTKADWTAQHGAAIATARTQLGFARSTLDHGDRQAILSACNLLHDDLNDVQKALPVPNATVDSALRKAVASLSSGVSDCLQGARLASVASITERAMAELSDASTLMDTANQAIIDWK